MPCCTKINACRLCGETTFDSIIDLGVQALTGIFPKEDAADLARGPLELVKCRSCHLVQLAHSYDLSALYGTHYGYTSSLNASMVDHLRAKVRRLQALCPTQPGDIVLDIGSNDGTTLSFHAPDVLPVGMDPSAGKFAERYRPDAHLIVDFFSAKRFQEVFPGNKARIITSIAMFYDLEDPEGFARQIAAILALDGVWHFEQSYLPAMLEATAYDTICHEHLEYYSLRQIKRLLDNAGLKIIDVEFNAVNGGSFAVTAAHAEAAPDEAANLVAEILEREARLGLDSLEIYHAFRDRIEAHREALLRTIERLRAEGLTVVGYGASTKGNVILQYCGLDRTALPCIAEVNTEKFGCFTPGSNIPIVSEAAAKALHPDVFVVFPWHFKANLLNREAEFLSAGGRMLFPLPRIELVGV